MPVRHEKSIFVHLVELFHKKFVFLLLLIFIVKVVFFVKNRELSDLIMNAPNMVNKVQDGVCVLLTVYEEVIVDTPPI